MDVIFSTFEVIATLGFGDIFHESRYWLNNVFGSKAVWRVVRVLVGNSKMFLYGPSDNKHNCLNVLCIKWTWNKWRVVPKWRCVIIQRPSLLQNFSTVTFPTVSYICSSISESPGNEDLVHEMFRLWGVITIDNALDIYTTTHRVGSFGIYKCHVDASFNLDTIFHKVTSHHNIWNVWRRQLLCFCIRRNGNTWMILQFPPTGTDSIKLYDSITKGNANVSFVPAYFVNCETFFKP